jgi:hypothetical protein
MEPVDRLPIPVDECTLAALVLSRRGVLKGGLLGTLLAGASVLGPDRNAALAQIAEPHPDLQSESSRTACESLIPAAAGGPTPSNHDLLSVRWLGCACFEVVFRDQVLLLDTWYDRGPRHRPIGITPQQVTRANAIFIGHAHFDHIGDATPIARRTGAVVVGAPISTQVVHAQGLPATQTHTVTGLGGEFLHFEGFTVEPILAHHSVAPTSVNREGEGVGQEITDAYEAAIGLPTPEEVAALTVVASRGSFDPLIITQGTIAYLFTFDNGYRLLWLDSGGPITPQLRTVMERVRHTNLAIVAYTVQGLPRVQIGVTLPLVNLFSPDLYLPAHHDELFFTNQAVLPDMATEPLFMAIRDTLPHTRYASPLYRTPVCINIRTGEFSVGPR